MLSLAFCHILPDTASLNEKTPYGAMNGIFIMLGILLNFSTERLSIDLIEWRKSRLEKAAGGEAGIVYSTSSHSHGGGIDSHDHTHGNISFAAPATPGFPAAASLVLPEPGAGAASTPSAPDTAETVVLEFCGEGGGNKAQKQTRRVVVAHVVELGVVLHSVIIGLSVGMWEVPSSPPPPSLPPSTSFPDPAKDGAVER
jgi:hypothetical protein